MTSDRSTQESLAAAIAEAGLIPLTTEALGRFSLYLELLERWNAKLNLTAIRDRDGILRRHFVECIFCAQTLPQGIHTLLDYGSGGGFPGIPIAICQPEITVTMAESQGKKASFLREVVRTLGINAEVYPGRVNALATERVFDAVTLRAVDRMQAAVADGAGRVADGGWLVVLTTGSSVVALPEGFAVAEYRLPGLESGRLVVAARNVPRGT